MIKKNRTTKAIDMVGMRYGYLLVISKVDEKRYNRRCYLCKCDCGNEKIIVGELMRYGKTKSCGCNSRTSVTTHNMSKSRTYAAFRGMISRCNNKNHKRYHHYGGRGIKICDRWINSFSNFLTDMGERPTEKHSIDRINNNGNYEPSNCRWATTEQQLNNKRSNVYLKSNNETLTIAQWARKLNITESKIRHRIRRGCNDDECLRI